MKIEIDKNEFNNGKEPKHFKKMNEISTSPIKEEDFFEKEETTKFLNEDLRRLISPRDLKVDEIDKKKKYFIHSNEEIINEQNEEDKEGIIGN